MSFWTWVAIIIALGSGIFAANSTKKSRSRKKDLNK